MTTTSHPKGSEKTLKFKAPLLIFLFFCLSVLIRYHALNDSLREGHVWLTAHTVLTLQIWFDEGISRHHFSPVYSYDNEADKHMRSLASGIPDEEGRFYYVSYGPFSFLFAFFFLKLLGIYPNVLSVQIINLLVHLITSWLIYVLISKYCRKEAWGPIWPPALVGSMIYLFSMHPMWCHAYVYFADTLIQMLWAIGLYFAFELFLYKKIDQWRYLFGYGLTVFLSIYTEWLGLFFAGVVFCMAAIHAIHNRSYIRLMSVTAISVCLALTTIILQYASITGLDSFLKASLNKYVERSGYESSQIHFTAVNIQFVFRHYWQLYYPIAGSIAFLSMASWINRKPRANRLIRKDFAILVALSIFPIVIHHFVFLGFTRDHDFALLKTSLAAAILIGVLFHRSTIHADPSQKRILQIFSSSIICIMMILSLLSYFDIAEFDKVSKIEKFGGIVERTSSKDEALYLMTHQDLENQIMIFMAGHRSVSPQVQLIARRNLLGVKNKAEALEHMKASGHSKGRIYSLNRNKDLINIEPILLP